MFARVCVYDQGCSSVLKKRHPPTPTPQAPTHTFLKTKYLHFGWNIIYVCCTHTKGQPLTLGCFVCIHVCMCMFWWFCLFVCPEVKVACGVFCLFVLASCFTHVVLLSCLAFPRRMRNCGKITWSLKVR